MNNHSVEIVKSSASKLLAVLSLTQVDFHGLETVFYDYP